METVYCYILPDVVVRELEKVYNVFWNGKSSLISDMCWEKWVIPLSTEPHQSIGSNIYQYYWGKWVSDLAMSFKCQVIIILSSSLKYNMQRNSKTVTRPRVGRGICVPVVKFCPIWFQIRHIKWDNSHLTKEILDPNSNAIVCFCVFSLFDTLIKVRVFL